MKKEWIKDGKFIELSDDQRKDLSVEQLAEYTTDKSTVAIETKSEAIKAEILKETKKALEEANKGLMSVDDINTKLKEISEKAESLSKDATKDLVKEVQDLNKVIKEQGEAISRISEEGSIPEASKGLGNLLFDAMKKEGLIEESKDGDTGLEIKQLKPELFKKSGNVANFTIKSAIDMTVAATMLPGATPGSSIGFLTGYDMKDVRLNLTKDTHVAQVIPVTPTNKTYFGVLVEYSETDGTGTAAENASFSQSSFLMKTVEFKIHDIGTYFQVSVNQLEDIDDMISRINRIAPDRIMSSLDTKFFGSNTTDATDVQGIGNSTNSTAFVPSTWTGEVQSANLADVISRMKLQAELANEDVNTVWLHPSDYTRISELKDGDNNNIADRRLGFDNNGLLISISGLAVFKNKNVTTNTAFVMWNEACEIGLRKDMEVVIGLNTDDLTKRMRTILFWIRAANGIGKVTAIIYSDDLDAAAGILNIT